MHQIHPIILSGGFGTRLWPASRDSLPKQLLKIMGERSSFQETLLRIQAFPGAAPPLVIGNQAHRFLLAQQAMDAESPLAGLLAEPVTRDTAAAVAMAAIWLANRDPSASSL